ncbi:hypothetical protein M0O54_20050, partial [Acinetobacter lactucae]
CALLLFGLRQRKKLARKYYDQRTHFDLDVHTKCLSTSLYVCPHDFKLLWDFSHEFVQNRVEICAKR